MAPKTLEDLAATNGESTQIVQTASGEQVSLDSYNRYGAQPVGFNPRPLHELIHFLIGPIGEGKSTLVASAPRCAILDMDRKYDAIAHIDKSTRVFPFISIPNVNRLIEKLIEDKRAGRSPFDLIAIDSISTYVQLVRNHLTAIYIEMGWIKTQKRAQEKIGEALGVADVTDYGQEGAGWDNINQFIIRQMVDLASAGYGLIYVSHMVPHWTHHPDGSETFCWRHKLNEGVRIYCYRSAAYSGIVSRTVEEVEVPTDQVIKMSGRMVPVTETVRQETYTLNLLPPPTSQRQASLETRQHVPMGDKPIILPEGGGWQAYDQAYQEAIERRRAEFRTKKKGKGV